MPSDLAVRTRALSSAGSNDLTRETDQGNIMNYTYDKEGFEKVFSKSFTWISGFMRNVGRFADRPAITDPATDRVWTYADLNADVNRLANALKAGGLGAGDMVMYQLYNSPQFVFSYIAPQKLGAINSPVNFNFSAGETARLIDRDRPKAYIYDCDVKEMAQKAVELCSNKPDMIIAVDYRHENPELPEGHIFYDDFVKDSPAFEPVSDLEPDMYAEVTRLCTSGTTGTPKGVPLNNINEVLSAHDTIMHFPLSPKDVTMNMTPWFHRGGIHSGGPSPTLFAGASLVILRMFSAKACFECTEKYGVTFLIGVPSALGKLAQRQERHPADLSGLKGIVTMGSPLEREDCIRFQRLLTPNIFNGYGTTETFWNSFLRPYDLPDMAGSAGAPCTDDEVRVVNVYDDRKADPDDTVPKDGSSEGEIIIFSPEKSPLCYAEDPEQSAARYRGGWFYTNDAGVWDEHNFVSIRGRRDDMIICMGENIYPAELEEVINKNPKVADCMVTGVPDPSRGEAVAAYIIKADESLTVQEINHYCVESDDIAGYMCPRYYAFTDKLPYNATGKKQHVVLKVQAAEDLKEKKLLRP